MTNKINICGIKYKVVEVDDPFTTGETQFGEIDYKHCIIKICSDLCDDIRNETIFHESMHGILVHLGYNELASDEQFVQAVGNALSQAFKLK